jgi:hypothetical protein
MWTRLRFGAEAVTIFQCGGKHGGACASSPRVGASWFTFNHFTSFHFTCKPKLVTTCCTYLTTPNHWPNHNKTDTSVQQHRQHGSPNQDLARRHLPRRRTTGANDKMEQPPLNFQRHIRQVRRLRQQKSWQSEHHWRGEYWIDDVRTVHTN